MCHVIDKCGQKIFEKYTLWFRKCSFGKYTKRQEKEIAWEVLYQDDEWVPGLNSEFKNNLMYIGASNEHCLQNKMLQF